jgi:hypothetical protein
VCVCVCLSVPSMKSLHATARAILTLPHKDLVWKISLFKSCVTILSVLFLLSL